MKESEGTEEMTTPPPPPPPSTLICCKDSQPCPAVSQYQLDAPITNATEHLPLTHYPSGTKLRRDEEQLMAKQTQHMKLPKKQ